jgi:hypothetical protein
VREGPDAIHVAAEADSATAERGREAIGFDEHWEDVAARARQLVDDHQQRLSPDVRFVGK